MENYLFFFPLILTISTSQALKCYTCSSTEDQYDPLCVSDPSSDYVHDFNKKYCNIVRVEYKDPAGKISSISRSTNDAYLSGKTEDNDHIYYQMSCSTDYCNYGSGKSSSDRDHDYLADKTTIYCQGSDSNRIEMIQPHQTRTLILLVILTKMIL